MKGIEYIIDETGEKTAVVINMKQWGQLWEQFYQEVVLTKTSEQEKCLDQILAEKIDQALEWNANNPPQISDLQSLERKLNNHNE